MEDMLWIEDIVEVPPTLPFFTILRVDMVSFVDLHKVVVRRSAILALPNAQNRGQSKDGLKSERLKC
jgi:hypothetical protein